MRLFVLLENRHYKLELHFENIEHQMFVAFQRTIKTFHLNFVYHKTNRFKYSYFSSYFMPIRLNV